MLWDVDLSVLNGDTRIYEPTKCILPPRSESRLPVKDEKPGWGRDQLNPDFPETGLDLCRRTLWFQDDLNFLCKKYYLDDECEFFPEILDLDKYPEAKRDIYAKTAREFYFKVFTPKDTDEEDDDEDVASSESDFDEDDGFDSDGTDVGMLDSTLDFEEDDEEMNKIISFFAKMPKVTGLVQGMIDMMEVLNRILPLISMKIEDPKLKNSIGRTIDIIAKGIGVILKICSFLGIKVQKKPSGAIGQIVKNRFKKDKKEFLEYEIDELNKVLDSLEKVGDDEEEEDDNGKPPRGEIPIDVPPNHLYPQKMPLHPGPMHQPIVCPPIPPPPPRPEPPEDRPIPSVPPEPPPCPPKGENGIADGVVKPEPSRPGQS